MTERSRARARFCSIACKDADRTKRRRAAIIAARPERVCAFCGGPVAAERRSHATVCSPKCRTDLENRKKLDAERLAKADLARFCDQCGGAIPSTRRLGARFCSRACYGKGADARWRERSAGYNRNYLYGVSREEYEALLARQDNRCAICRTDVAGGKGGWHLDHSHETGTVRGLLCHHCNLALGNFEDDPSRLRNAIAYLEVASST